MSHDVELASLPISKKKLSPLTNLETFGPIQICLILIFPPLLGLVIVLLTSHGQLYEDRTTLDINHCEYPFDCETSNNYLAFTILTPAILLNHIDIFANIVPIDDFNLPIFTQQSTSNDCDIQIHTMITTLNSNMDVIEATNNNFISGICHVPSVYQLLSFSVYHPWIKSNSQYIHVNITFQSNNIDAIMNTNQLILQRTTFDVIYQSKYYVTLYSLMHIMLFVLTLILILLWYKRLYKYHYNKYQSLLLATSLETNNSNSKSATLTESSTTTHWDILSHLLPEQV
jgi:hypothetical protein